MKIEKLSRPLAIAMWDFSWLERRWSGAGYEDWDTILDELTERGYNALRIDAYPHLVARGPTRRWTIKPCWNQHQWGSPARNQVQVQPHLNQFLKKCPERGILVALSSWFQKTEGLELGYISSAKIHAMIWKKTLDTIAAEDNLDTLL